MKPQVVGVTVADLLGFCGLFPLDFPCSFMIPGITCVTKLGCDVSCLQPTLITEASREARR